MRALFVCDGFQKHAAQLAEGLREEGHEVMLLCRDQLFEFDNDLAARKHLMDWLHDRGIQVKELPARYRDVSAIPALTRIARDVRAWCPEVVHAQQHADPRAFFIIRHLPLVLTIHDPVPHSGGWLGPAAVKQLRAVAARGWHRRAGALVVHGDGLATALRDTGYSGRVEVVPHGTRVLSSPAPAPATPTVGFFGALRAYKGLEVLAAAMSIVWERRPEVRLLVAGKGDCVPDIRDARMELINEYIPDSAILDTISRMSLLTLPYLQASQSGPGTRAVGLGVPTIVSRVGALAELTLDDSYSVPPGDPGKLAEAILRHIDDGDAIRWRVLRELGAPRSWRAVARRYVEIYRSVIATAMSVR